MMRAVQEQRTSTNIWTTRRAVGRCGGDRLPSPRLIGYKSRPDSRPFTNHTHATRETPDMERSLIILKPDAVQRGLVGEIVTRFERKGIQIAGMKFMKIPTQLAETHYEPHRGKGFYAGLVKFMTSSPV